MSNPSDLNERTATTLLSALRSGETSAEALMEACLSRVQARDDDVRAWAYLDADYALEQAQAADAKRAKGEPLGALHGIPVGIKDIIDTADMPTENGSALFPGRRPQTDAACVAALRAAGAIVMGKTETTELANTNPSKTRNPHNLAHTPGGSSSGSGAGVADFQVPLALGTQTGGSVIRPASFNGVYGLKPTLGLIPRAGVLLQSHTLDTVGVYGRSVVDLAHILDALSIPEPSDPLSYAGSRASLVAALGEPLKNPPRFAFLKTPAWDETHDGAKQGIQAVAKALGSQCQAIDIPGPYNDILDLHGAVFAGENAHYYGDFYEQQPERMSEKLRSRMAPAMTLPAREYVAALVQRDVVYADVQRALQDADAILCLSATGPAPEGFATTGSPAYNSPWTYLGVPCFSLPHLSVNGLPVGVQLVGARGSEAHLVKVAAWLDAELRAKPIAPITA